jgi:hypothetical protein
VLNRQSKGQLFANPDLEHGMTEGEIKPTVVMNNDQPVGEKVLNTRAQASKRQSNGAAQTFILIRKKQREPSTHKYTNTH